MECVDRLAMTKYREVFNMKRVNELYLEGYGLRETVTEVYTDDVSGRICTKKSWIMSLRSEKVYDNITNLQDIPPDMVDGFLAKGWIVADSWSKTIRMVKKVEASDS